MTAGAIHSDSPIPLATVEPGRSHRQIREESQGVQTRDSGDHGLSRHAST